MLEEGKSMEGPHIKKETPKKKESELSPEEKEGLGAVYTMIQSSKEASLRAFPDSAQQENADQQSPEVKETKKKKRWFGAAAFSTTALAALLLVPQISEARWGSEGRHGVTERQTVRANDAESIKALGKTNVQRDIIGIIGQTLAPVLGDVIRSAAQTGRQVETIQTPKGATTTERDYVPDKSAFGQESDRRAHEEGKRQGASLSGRPLPSDVTDRIGWDPAFRAGIRETYRP